MMIKSYSVLIFLIVFSFAQVLCAKEDAKTCEDYHPLGANLKVLKLDELKKLQATLKRYDFLKVDFEQRIFPSLRKRERKMSGVGYFSKSSKFKWIKSSQGEEIIYDGKDLYIYLPKENIAQKFSHLGSQAKEIEEMGSMVLDFDSLLARYELKKAVFDTNARRVSVILVPKSGGEMIDLMVRASLLKNSVEMVCMSYKGGKIITYDFSNPDFKPLPVSTFEFKPAKGVKLEVVD